MKKIRLILVSLCVALVFCLLVAPVSTVRAVYDPLNEACDGSAAAQSSNVCRDRNFNSGQNPLDAQSGIVPKVANIIALVGGVLAIIFIMVNGLTIMTSTGDSAKINKARDGLIYGAIGVVVIVMARLIVALIMRFL